MFTIHIELSEIQLESGKICPFLEICHMLNMYANSSNYMAIFKQRSICMFAIAFSVGYSSWVIR
jgi:hypothetical protein